MCVYVHVCTCMCVCVTSFVSLEVQEFYQIETALFIREAKTNAANVQGNHLAWNSIFFFQAFCFAFYSSQPSKINAISGDTVSTQFPFGCVCSCKYKSTPTLSLVYCTNV